MLLALDWAKAFDNVSPDALCRALQRFGIPPEFISVVRAIYTDRTFEVRDAGSVSNAYPQNFGISQGCPLSPFLFAIVMTVLLHDAKREATPNLDLTQQVHELVYADDTLLVATTGDEASGYMPCVQRAGCNSTGENWKFCRRGATCAS